MGGAEQIAVAHEQPGGPGAGSSAALPRQHQLRAERPTTVAQEQPRRVETQINNAQLQEQVARANNLQNPSDVVYGMILVIHAGESGRDIPEV